MNYNTTNFLNLPLDINEKDISPKRSENGKKRIKIVKMDNDEEDIRLADIDSQKLASPNLILQNRLLSKLILNFKNMIFSESDI